MREMSSGILQMLLFVSQQGWKKKMICCRTWPMSLTSNELPSPSRSPDPLDRRRDWFLLQFQFSRCLKSVPPNLLPSVSINQVCRRGHFYLAPNVRVKCSTWAVNARARPPSAIKALTEQNTACCPLRFFNPSEGLLNLPSH